MKNKIGWEKFARKGKNGGYKKQMNSIKRCIDEKGVVRGYYSKMRLNPFLKDTSALYPSHDHLYDRKNHDEMVIETRIVNDMKSMLTEKEFWKIIEHLYAVGRQNGKIKNVDAKTYPKWKPKRDYAEKRIKTS